MNSKRADACVEMLSLYLIRDMRSGSLFRTLVDDWFAYSKGEPYLNKNGNPVWFNNPDPTKPKYREALLGMDYISIEAKKRIDGGKRGLVKDHSIPLKKLEYLLKDLPEQSKSPASVLSFLESHYRLGVLTEDEHKLLKGKLKSDMPDGWDGRNLQARYKAANIPICCTEKRRAPESAP